MNKKVALISLFTGDVKGVPPLGLLYLATALKKSGIESKIIHCDAGEADEIIKQVKDYKPDLTGMSVFTGYNNVKYVELSQALKKEGFKIAWGNAHPSLLPEQVLKEPFVDFAIIGEGEETIVELAQKINDNDRYGEILGLGYKNKNGEIVINHKRPQINIDDYLIDWSLIDMGPYLIPYFSNKFQKALAVTTSRGCPFNCQFCYNLVFNDRKWRAHSADAIINNLKPLIAKYKIDALRFYDDNFFVNKKRAFEIVRGLGLPYSAEARVEYIDEEFMTELKATNCQEVMFGFESGSDRILKEVVKKGTGKEQIINAVKLFNNSGIMCSGSMVFGFPSETKEEYDMTMKFILELLEINNHLAFTCGWFLPFPGTGLYEEAIKRGFKPPEDTVGWEKFDRWRNDYTMEWIDWDYKEAVKYTRIIVNLLAMAYKRNIGFLKKILKWRINNSNYKWPVDIYFFAMVRNIYMFGGKKSPFEKFIQKIMISMVKVIQNRQKRITAKSNL